MTGPSHAAARAAAPTTAAAAAAAEAAARSEVEIVHASTLSEVHEALALVDAVWRPPPGRPAMGEEMLWAMVHVGNYCSIARDRSGPVAVCVAFLGLHPSYSLHSHAAGVTAAGTGRGIGFALKQDQRAWALERGIGTVTWTYDPLVRRNAFFNLTRLGARPVEYVVDFYGEMTDAINTGQGSDRFMVDWDLTSDDVARRALRRATEPDLAALIRDGAVTMLADVDGEPVRRGPAVAADAGFAADPVALVQVPADIEALRAADPDRARRWRSAVRAVLGDLLAQGWSVTGMSREGHYVMRRAG